VRRPNLKTKRNDKPKRCRPRFSVRTLAIVVSLVCCYAACWEPTKTQGTSDIERQAGAHSIAQAIAPLLIRADALELPEASDAVQSPPSRWRRHYLWFFGVIVIVQDREMDWWAGPSPKAQASHL